MVTLLPESQIARRPNGRLLLNGCFAVWHEHGQRAIFDCRPSNPGEERLRFTVLPNGCILASLRLGRQEGLRGSGDDLSNWFYQMKESPELWGRRAFGRQITGETAEAFGSSADGKLRMVLTVLGMGTSNARHCPSGP